MDLQQIYENNRLIAEFMGWESNRYSNLPNKLHKGNSDDERSVYVGSLEYHTSWDWIMHVVEKIDNINCNDYTGFTFQINKTSVSVFCHVKSRMDGVIFQTPWRKECSKIEAVYEGVLEFVKFYNTKTPHQNNN